MRQLTHLARRFFESLRARHPDIDDQGFVADHLSGAAAAVFWEQPVADLAHAVRVARRVAQALPDRPELVRAALLHDVGKRSSGLGTLGRALATGLSWTPLRLPDAMRRYRDHAAIGAAELADIGCEAPAVDFARNHHGMPDHIDPTAWSTLQAADHE